MTAKRTPQIADPAPAQIADPAPAQPNPRAPGPAVRISAVREGVYACGQRHRAAPQAYPAGYFSARQVEQMQGLAELTVEIIAASAADPVAT